MTSPAQTPRQGLMGLLARARPERLAELAAEIALPEAQDLRPAQSGTVMLQGRIGGTGAPFNLGEMTVTRCVLQVGAVTGHAHVQGRDKAHARRAALIDALWQVDPDLVERAILGPLRAEEDARRRTRAAKAAATRVEFFTLVRGEDA